LVVTREKLLRGGAQLLPLTTKSVELFIYQQTGVRLAVKVTFLHGQEPPTARRSSSLPER